MPGDGRFSISLAARGTAFGAPAERVAEIKRHVASGEQLRIATNKLEMNFIQALASEWKITSEPH